jgi:hypothetical protein
MEKSEKLTKKQKDQKESWEEIQKTHEIYFDDEVSIVKQLVSIADTIQSKICNQADKYKIDILQEINDSFDSIDLEKNVWLDIVRLQRLKIHQNVTPKILNTLRKQFNKSVYNISITSAHIKHITDDVQDTKIITLPIVNDELDINLDIFKTDNHSEEFIRLLTEAADIQHEILHVLYPELGKLSDAFCHITGLTHKEFKHLVDVTHYRFGGYPSENSPPRHWAVFKNYRYINLLMKRFRFDHAEMWNKRFGITSQFEDYQHFTWNIFSIRAESWINIKLLKPSVKSFKENSENYKTLNIEYWHILAFIDNYVFVINEEDSTIESVISIDIFNESISYQDFTTNFEMFNIENSVLISSNLSDSDKDLCKTCFLSKLN